MCLAFSDLIPEPQPREEGPKLCVPVCLCECEFVSVSVCLFGYSVSTRSLTDCVCLSLCVSICVFLCLFVSDRLGVSSTSRGSGETGRTQHTSYQNILYLQKLSHP